VRRIQNDSKWRSRATSGSIFEILGGFRKDGFFEDFVIGKKLVKISKNAILGGEGGSSGSGSAREALLLKTPRAVQESG
jgi:hypothetical protein